MKRLFECRRYDINSDEYEGDWRGALLIFANDEDDAIRIFNEYEGPDCFGEEQYPKHIKEITKFDGVIYNNYER